MVACYYFLLLCCSGEWTLEVFLVSMGFSDGGSRIGFIPGCEENSMEIVVWIEVTWAGHTHANKVAT